MFDMAAAKRIARWRGLNQAAPQLLLLSPSIFGVIKSINVLNIIIICMRNGFLTTGSIPEELKVAIV